MLKTIVAAMTLSVSLLTAQSTEATILVTCTYVRGNNSPCMARDFTWFIPGDAGNEPASEQAMLITFPDFTYFQYSINGGPKMDRPGIGTPSIGGYFQVLDPDGSVCDVVEIFASGGSPDDIKMFIVSDPPHPPNPILGLDNLGTLPTETDAGATGSIGAFPPPPLPPYLWISLVPGQPLAP